MSAVGQRPDVIECDKGIDSEIEGNNIKAEEINNEKIITMEERIVSTMYLLVF